MSFPERTKVNRVDGVAASSTVTIAVAKGVMSLEELLLTQGGTTFAKDDFSNLEAKLNGNTFQKYRTVSDLETLNAYYGNAAVANQIYWPFIRTHLNDLREAELFALGLADIATLHFTGDIDGTAVAPTLTVKATEQQYNRSGTSDIGALRNENSFSWVTDVRNFTYAFSAAGEHEINDLPLIGWLQACHLFKNSGAGNVTSVRAELNGTTIWDLTDAEMEAYLEKAHVGRTRQTDVYHMDWMTKNKMGDHLPLAGADSLRLFVTTDDAINLTVIPEYMRKINAKARV